MDREINIKLRALEPGDVDLLFNWENDQKIWHLSNTIVPFSKYILAKYIENSHLDIYETKQLRLMIDASINGVSETIGAIDMFDFDPYHNRAGVGILVSDELKRNKGYASKALQTFIDYAFNVLQLNQLYCNIEPGNEPSIKLFKKFNFELIGNKKSWNKTPIGYTDELMFQLLKSNS